MSPPLALARVAPETWDFIFDELLGPTGQSARHVAAVVRVCKSWRTCAEPVLYRRLFLRGKGQMRALASHLIGCEIHDRHPGRWTRELRVMAGVEGLSDILLLLPNLRVYASSTKSPLTVREVLPLLQVSRDALRSLDFFLDGNHDQACVGLAGQFPRLQELQIGVMGAASRSSLEKDPLPSLRLPELRVLRLSSSPDATPLYLELLSRSWLPSLNSFHLGLRSISIVSHRLLSEFLGTHGAHLVRLDLDLPVDLHPIIVACSSFPVLRVLKFHTNAPHDGMVSLIPKSVRMLHITSSTDDGEDIWPFLREVSASQKVHVECIRIALRPLLGHFSWATAGSEHPGMVPGMLEMSLALGKRGVRLEDEDGMVIRLMA